MNLEQINVFEKISSQIESLFEEISVLGKKAPNDAVNLFKLGLINRVLIDANDLLSNKNLPFSDFKGFSEDSIPTNSDVTMILSQYLSCLEKLRADNIKLDWKYNGDKYVEGWFWVINEKDSDIRTAPPKKIKG